VAPSWCTQTRVGGGERRARANKLFYKSRPSPDPVPRAGGGEREGAPQPGGHGGAALHKKLNDRNIHPDAIVRDLHEMRPELWCLDARYEQAARSEPSPKGKGRKGSSPRGGGDTAHGVCFTWLNGGCLKQPNCAFAHPEHLEGAGSYVASPSKGGGGKKGGGPGKRGKPAEGGTAEDG